MIRIKGILTTILLVGFCALTLAAQGTRDRITRGGCSAGSPISGVYRIDVESSDKLYSVIEGATSNVPYGEQQQFFNDLAVRLIPPDLLAVECRGNRVSLASSRARRVEFIADGVTRNVRYTDGRTVRSRIAFERDALTFNSSGKGDDSLSFTFAPLDGGKRLRVTRRISAQELIEPLIINTIYEKVSEVARWDIFDETRTDTQIAKQTAEQINADKTATVALASPPITRPVSSESGKADALRKVLNQWIAATNDRDIERQMSFYMPLLQAFYLTRNAARSVVRAEKQRAFATAKSIDIRAAQPEIIFQDGGRTAVMRFRKKYSIVDRAKTRRGEVIQELRWQQTKGGWRIFSERDIRVIN
jgi:ketosteroid isomerase-like protein